MMTNEPELRFVLHPQWEAVVRQKWPDYQQEEDENGFCLSTELMDGQIISDWRHIILSRKEDDGDYLKMAVPSLQELFRGDYDPGTLEDTENIKYMYIITVLEPHWISRANLGVIEIPKDETMYEVYTQLRRRPDGKPGQNESLHAVIWQCLAFLAGIIEISEAEYVAIVGRLARSASTFRTSYSSTNMFTHLLPLYADKGMV